MCLVSFSRGHTPCSIPSLLQKPVPHSVLSRGSLGTAVCLAGCLSGRCTKRPDDPESSCDRSAASCQPSSGCQSVCRQSLSAKTGLLTGGIREAEERLLGVAEPCEVQGPFSVGWSWSSQETPEASCPTLQAPVTVVLSCLPLSTISFLAGLPRLSLGDFRATTWRGDPFPKVRLGNKAPPFPFHCSTGRPRVRGTWIS